MRGLSRSIRARTEMAAGLDRDIEEARGTFAQMELNTWGGARCWRSRESASGCCRGGRWTIRAGPGAIGLP